MRDEVAARARAVFFDSRVHHTAGNTGLLIYVSLYERMAAVLADQSIVDKLGQDALDELCAALTKKLRDLHPADAICQTIPSPARNSRRSCLAPKTTSTSCPTRWSCWTADPPNAQAARWRQAMSPCPATTRDRASTAAVASALSRPSNVAAQ